MSVILPLEECGRLQEVTDSAVDMKAATNCPEKEKQETYLYEVSSATVESSPSSSSSLSPSPSPSENRPPSLIDIIKDYSVNRKGEKEGIDSGFDVMKSEGLHYVNDLSGSTEIPGMQHKDAGRKVSPAETLVSSMSSVRVEIDDIGGDDSHNFTTSTLRVCKKRVLRPYWALLACIGWRPIKKESVNANLLQWKVVNFIYTFIIILLLLYTYMYEILACEWKLDMSIDNKTPKIKTTTPFTTTTINSTNVTAWVLSEANTASSTKGNETRPYVAPDYTGCAHIGTTYVLPNVLHLVAYMLGLYYFRWQENEQLYALMEKVYLQAAHSQARTASQQRLVNRLRVIMAVGVLWVFFTVFLQCIFIWAFDFPTLPLFRSIDIRLYWTMFGTELCGRIIFNSVILAIVVNYVIQCEMIKFYVRGLAMRLQEKSTDLKAAMKDLLTIRHSLSLLNGIISKMTSLVTFIMAEISIIGLCLLLLNERDDFKIWVYRSLFPFGWIFILSLPLWQAARVNSIILRIKKIGLEMRVFGYKGASILDLDSFLNFVQEITPKAKLFNMPVLTSYLIFGVVISALIVLLLFQTGRMGMDDNFL